MYCWSLTWKILSIIFLAYAVAAAKSLQPCLTLCNPIDGSPPGFPVPGILQARTVKWVAISFSNAWKWKWSRSVMSDSKWPHGLQPTRLLHPWDSPDKGTGVACHCLLLLAYEMSAIVQSFEHSLSLLFFVIGMKTDLFQFCGHCWVFQICWYIECSTFTALSFRIWNSSNGILSPPLALLVVRLPKAHLTSHSIMSGSRWVIPSPWLSGH